MNKSTEESINDFLDEIEGIKEPEKNNNEVVKITHDTYGDYVYYKNGTVEYHSIED